MSILFLSISTFLSFVASVFALEIEFEEEENEESDNRNKKNMSSLEIEGEEEENKASNNENKKSPVKPDCAYRSFWLCYVLSVICLIPGFVFLIIVSYKFSH